MRKQSQSDIHIKISNWDTHKQGKQKYFKKSSKYFISNNGLNVYVFRDPNVLDIRSLYPYNFANDFSTDNFISSTVKGWLVVDGGLIYLVQDFIQKYIEQQIQFFINKKSFLIYTRKKAIPVIFYRTVILQWDYQIKQQITQLMYKRNMKSIPAIQKACKQHSISFDINLVQSGCSLFDEQKYWDKWTMRYGYNQFELKNKIYQQLGQNWIQKIMEQLREKWKQ